MRSLELTKLRHRSAPQESSRVPNPRTDPPTQKVALDSTTSTTRCSTAYVHPATSHDVFSLAGRMPSTHSPARPGPDNPTRRIAQTRFAPGNERRRLLAVEPSTARPSPLLRARRIFAWETCCTSVLDTRFLRNSVR